MSLLFNNVQERKAPKSQGRRNFESLRGYCNFALVLQLSTRVVTLHSR